MTDEPSVPVSVPASLPVAEGDEEDVPAAPPEMTGAALPCGPDVAEPSLEMPAAPGDEIVGPFAVEGAVTSVVVDEVTSLPTLVEGPLLASTVGAVTVIGGATATSAAGAGVEGVIAAAAIVSFDGVPTIAEGVTVAASICGGSALEILPLYVGVVGASAGTAAESFCGAAVGSAGRSSGDAGCGAIELGSTTGSGVVVEPGVSVVGSDPALWSIVPAVLLAVGATASGVPVWSVTTGALAIAVASASTAGDDAYGAGLAGAWVLDGGANE